MSVLVDGNNLLYAAARVEPDRPPGRTQLCEKLGVWARRYRRQVRVVFDGTVPPEPRASQIGDPSIQVDYSGPESADAVVIRAIDGDSAPRRLTVVSSDREIAAAARWREAAPVRSEDFWAQLEADLARPIRTPLEPGEKRRGLTQGQTEEWLREFGFNDIGDSI